jgi:glycosyltransferase involved in cell wall biosynthesis
MPAVSIITCTYNRAHLIGETIESIIAQTFQDFEYIIVDEGSTDNTEEVVKSFPDSRIHYFKIPNTQGHLSAMRNFGIKKSQGKYIAFVDSDDLWLPEKLKKQFSALEADNSIGFSYTDIETFNQREILSKTIYKKSGTFCGSAFEGLIHNEFVICATTLFFRKNCLDKIGYQNEDFRSGDFDFTVSLSINFKALAIYEPLVRVRRHEGNVSNSSYLNRKFTHLKILERVRNTNHISQSDYKKIKTNVYYAFGMQLLKLKEYKWANYFFIKNIISKPLQIKAWVRLIFTFGKQVMN